MVGMVEYVRDPATGLLTAWTGYNGWPERMKGAYFRNADGSISKWDGQGAMPRGALDELWVEDPATKLLSRYVHPLDMLFGDGSDGLDLRFDGGTPMWQDPDGVTPVTATGQVIGLGLDAHGWGGRSLSQVAAAQPNIAPPFVPGGAGWEVVGSDGTHIVTFGAGSMRYQSDTTSPALLLRIPNALTVGRAYEVTIPCTARASGSIKMDCFGSRQVAAAVGTISFVAIATGSTLDITRNSANVDLTLGDITVREIPGNHATQATAGFKPTYQPEGANADAVDDRLLTSYLAQAETNSFIGVITVPASLSAIQAIAGGSIGSSQRFFLAVSTAGILTAGFGSAILAGGADLRGQTVVVASSTDGVTNSLFVDGALAATGAASGSVVTGVAVAVGANSSSGTPASFFGGSIKRLLVARKALTLPDYLAIRAQLLAGG